MPNEVKIIMSADGSAAIRGLSEVSDKLKKTEIQIKDFGLAMAGIGAGMMAGLTVLAYSAMSAEKSWMRVGHQLGLAGLSVQENIKVIKQYAAEQQALTGINDELIGQFVGDLLPVTKNLQLALEATSVAMSMAAATGQDVSSITRIMTMAMNGDIEMLRRYVPAIRDVSTEQLKLMSDAEKITFALNALRGQFGGLAIIEGASAEGRLRALKSTVGDLFETLGATLLPAIISIAERLRIFISAIIDWAEKNKALSATIITITAILAPLAIVLGGLSLVLPHLVSSLVILKGALLGLGLVPIIAIIGGITALALAIKYLYDESVAAEKALTGYRHALTAISLTVLEKELNRVNEEIGRQRNLIISLNKELVEKGIINAWIKGILTDRKKAEEELNRLLAQQTTLQDELKDKQAAEKIRMKAEVETSRTAIEAIRKLNEQIQDLINKNTLSPLALIEKQAEAWRKAGANRVLIDKWVTGESLKVEMDYHEKIAAQNKAIEEAEARRIAEETDEVIAAYDARARLEENLTLATMTEYQKRLYEVDKWVSEQMRLNFLSAESYAEYKARELEIHEAAERQRADITIAENERATKEQIRLLEEAAAAERTIKQSTLDNTISLLMMLGTKHKAAAVLGIAIATVAEAIRAYQATITASTLAFASQLVPGDPTSIARAAAAAATVKAWGMANVALIGAIGAMRIAGTLAGPGGVGAGAGKGYSPVSPIETLEERREEKEWRSQVINVHIYGNIVDHDAFARELVPAIQKAQSDGVR